MTYQERVNATTTLDELCSTLNEIESKIAAQNTFALFDSKIDNYVDLAALPTFGGVEPNDTSGIWSWDATRFLYADGSIWTVEERPELEDA